MHPVLWRQKRVLQKQDLEAVWYGDGVVAAVVVFDFKHEGPNAADLEASSSDATDECTVWSEIRELSLEQRYCA